MAGSVAALEDDRVLVEQDIHPGQRSAQSLAPAMRDVLASVGWKPAEVELVAVAIGPGSFTGLRVGVATAKTFAYVAGCKIIGVDTLEAIAWRTSVEHREFYTILDAHRKQVFAARFSRAESGDLERKTPSGLI